MCPRPAAERFDAFVGLDPPAAAVVRVFQAEQRTRGMCGSSSSGTVASCSTVKHAALSRQWPGRHAVELRVAALLVIMTCAVGLADQGIARPAMQPHADKVRHRARGHKQRRLFAQHGGNPLLQGDHRRIVAEDVVADDRRGHDGAHARRGAGYRVAAKILGRRGHGFLSRCGKGCPGGDSKCIIRHAYSLRHQPRRGDRE